VDLRQSGSSYYGTFKSENGNVFTLRLSNHNATVSNFDNESEAEGVSIVISAHPTSGIHNDGVAHVVEYFYRKKDLWNAYGNPLADILGGISHLLRTGEYTDPTGLAIRQEVNTPEGEPLSTPDGTVYGFAQGGTIYLTPEGLNPNTPIHEYAHLWVAAIRRRAKDLYRNLQDLFSRANLPDMWAELDRDPHYAYLSDEAKMSEIISRFSGKRGAERMEQEAQSGTFDPDTMDMHADLSLAFGRIETFSNRYNRYKDTYIRRHRRQLPKSIKIKYSSTISNLHISQKHTTFAA